ncbi:MAG: FecR domain-containing protein [Gammaproteobacteria bacterium]|nr:FecR domain-containing protein [Gammaproteobacteria bacterium]
MATGLTLAATMLISGNLDAAPVAGEVVKITGRAMAATQDGDIRQLSAGAEVESGDTLVTNRSSYMRVKMVDGASVILRPNTRFHIEDYNVSETPSENRSFLSLLKGGFRSVTGAIGKRNRGGYRVRTAVATIGIRGTDIEVLSCQGDCPEPDGTYLGVNDGEAEMTTSAGTQRFSAGTYGYVDDPNSPPVEVPASGAGQIGSDPLADPDCGG